MTTSPDAHKAESEVDLVYTLTEAANRLKVSKWTVNRLIEEGEIGSILIRTRRLVRASDLSAYLERQGTATTGSSNGR